MSLLRLLLFACKLRGGERNVDPIIRGGRAITKGAPIRFWCIFSVVFWNGCSHVAAVRRGASASSGAGNADGTSDFSADFRRLEVRIENAMQLREEAADMWYGPRIYPARAIPVPPLLVDDQDVDDQAQAPDIEPAEVRVPIRVMRVQNADHYTSIWVTPGASSEEVMARANETILLGSDHYYLVEVYPQPDDQVISTILIPRWWRRTVFTAVAIDPTECGQPIYAAMMPKTAFYADVGRATSPLTPSIDGIHVIFENNLIPIGPESIIRPTEGSLLRIKPSSRDTEPLVDLDIALQDLDWVHDVNTLGMPRAPGADGKMLVGCEDYAILLTTAYPPSMRTLHRQIATLHRAEFDDVALIVPQYEIDSVAYRGKPAMGMVGTFQYSRHPSFVDGTGCAIFIDARDLGVGLSFHVVESRLISLEDLLDLVDYETPEDIVISLTGYEYQREGSTNFLFTTGAVATLWVDLPGSEAALAAQAERLAPQGEEDEPHEQQPPDPDAGSDPPRDGRWDVDDDAGSPYGDGRDSSRSPRDGYTDDIPPTHLDLRTILDDAEITANGTSLIATALHFLDAEAKNGLVRPVFAMTERHRALPTPCRAHCQLPPLAGQDVDFAREHNSGSAARDADEANHSCHTICLADFLGPPVFDLARHQVEVMPMAHVTQYQDLLCPWKPGNLGNVWEVDGLKEVTKAALMLQNKLRPPGFPDLLEVFTDGSARDGCAGFAVAIVAHWYGPGECQCLGAFADRVVTDPAEVFYAGATDMTALMAEWSGILWGLVWALAHWHMLGNPRITFRFDCATVGFGSAGDWKTGGETIGEHARAVARVLEQTVGFHSVSWQHVRGHSGNEWNELVDVIAKAALTGLPSAIPGPSPQWKCAVADFSMEWMVTTPTSLRFGNLPPLQNGSLAWNEDIRDPIAVAADRLIPTNPEPEGKCFCLRVSLITANVQSAIGKVKYFEQQLLHKQVHVLMCQEAKGREGCIRTKDFLRYSSNGEGVWGTEVWINRRIPFATLDGDPVYVQESDVSVVDLGPRHLHLIVTMAGQKVHSASLHIPQQNRDADERNAMLDCLRNISRLSAHHWLFVGVDANSRVPGSHDDVTGTAVMQEADAAGINFVQVLQQERLWLPNTYNEVHHGPIETWVHPTGKRSQIDFFITNHNLQRCSAQSCVCHDFDLLNTRDDHFPLEIQVEQTVIAQPAVNRKLKRGLDLDLRALDCLDVKRRFEVALDSRKCDSISWSVDVNTHAALIEDGILAALHDVLPRKCDTPKSNYIPDDAWAARSRKLHFKQLTADRKDNFKFGVLALTWKLLKGALGAEAAVLSWLLNKLVLLHEVAALAVKFATMFVRVRIKERKNEIMAKFANNLGKVQPEQILRQVKSLGLGKRRAAPWKRCLPRLVDSSGRPVVGRGSLDELWLDVFGNMELGVVKPADELIAEACVRVQGYDDFEPELRALPTISEVEAVVRDTEKGKASGLDRIPGEALRRAPGRVASMYFPLMLKAATGLHQSIQWRGGILAECYKQSGSQQDTASYRSLFVSSVPGKAYHRLLRGKIAANTEDCLADTHFGVRW